MKNKSGRVNSMKLKHETGDCFRHKCRRHVCARRKAGRPVPAGKSDFCRSQKCMGQGLWLYEQEP